MLKRQIFGRQGFRLLRERILLAPQSRPVSSGPGAEITIRA